LYKIEGDILTEVMKFTHFSEERTFDKLNTQSAFW